MSTQAISIQRKHLPALDAVRGVAILGVFLFHLLSVAWGRNQLEWGALFRHWPADRVGFLWFYPLTFGVFGVPLFFVLSGFVIHYSTVTSSRSFSALEFYSRRFWRIYPPYAVALLAFYVIRTGEYQVTRLSVITHAFLVQDFSSQPFFLINPSFWSIATEVQFYLVYPLLILALILSDDWVPPSGPSWNDCAVILAENRVDELVAVAERYEPRRRETGQFARQAFESWFCPEVCIFRILQCCEEILLLRPAGHDEREFQEHWSDWQFKSENGWTFPQRATAP